VALAHADVVVGAVLLAQLVEVGTHVRQRVLVVLSADRDGVRAFVGCIALNAHSYLCDTRSVRARMCACVHVCARRNG